MLVDWDTVASWAGEKQGQKEAELSKNIISSPLVFKWQKL